MPCRARNATRHPSNMPMMTGALGLPKGVVRSCSEMSLRPGMEYSPEPPMIARLGLESIIIPFNIENFAYCTRKRKVTVGNEKENHKGAQRERLPASSTTKNTKGNLMD